MQIARALQYLHSINLVHLDLKPANLLLTSDGRLRLADFGNCHLLLRDMAREREREKEGDAGGLRGVQGSWRCELAGTLAYRAPELLKGEPPSLQADIYSLGITLWQIVSGVGVVGAGVVFIDVVLIVLLVYTLQCIFVGATVKVGCPRFKSRLRHAILFLHVAYVYTALSLVARLKKK